MNALRWILLAIQTTWLKGLASGLLLMALLGMTASHRETSYRSLYQFRKTYCFEDTDVPKALKEMEKDDCRLKFRSDKKGGRCVLDYQYSYGLFAQYHFRMREQVRHKAYQINLYAIIVNLPKTNDSLPYFETFDGELVYRIRTQVPRKIP